MDRKRALDLGGETDAKKPRTVEESLAFIEECGKRAIAAHEKTEAIFDSRAKNDAPGWDSTWEDSSGRVGTGSIGTSSWADKFASTSRTPWLCGLFPKLRRDSDYEGAPALRVVYDGRTFGSAAAAFGYAKAAYFDARLGATEDYKNAFADVPEGAAPLGDIFTEGLVRAERVDKGAFSTRVAALGRKFTKAKAGRLFDEIEAARAGVDLGPPLDARRGALRRTGSTTRPTSRP